MKKIQLKAMASLCICAMASSIMTICSFAGTEYNVGIIQYLPHAALDAATKGFEDVLTEEVEAAGGSVNYDLKDAGGDISTLANLVTAIEANDPDLILANATPPLQTLAAMEDTIPILGTSVTDYATALEIDDWDGTTGRNISGTSDLAPLDQQADMFAELLPDAKTIGIIYCSSEANSIYQKNKVKEYLEEDGLTVIECPFSDSNDLSSVVAAYCPEVDAFYIPTDNVAANNGELINNVALPAGVPIIAGEEGTCKGCGIATLTISYEDLGRETGKMAARILLDGEDISTMEIQYAASVTKEYNPTICEALGIEVPDDYVAIPTDEETEAQDET